MTGEIDGLQPEEPIFKMVNGVKMEMTPEEAREHREYVEGKRRKQAEGKYKHTSYPAPDGYEIRLVAFLDILGFKQLAVKAKDDTKIFKNLWNALKTLNLTTQIAYFGSTDMGPRLYDIAEVSDSIAISVLVDGSIDAAFSQVRWILSTLFDVYGLICRGGITVGPVIHDRSMIFGPALQDAIELESKADVPRVLIQDSVIAEALNPGVLEYGVRKKGHNVRQDTDGKYFVDYLSSPLLADEAHPFLSQYRSQVLNLINDPDNQNPKFWYKYEWLINYFNLTVEDYPKAGVSPIEIPTFSSYIGLQITEYVNKAMNDK